MKYLIRFFSAFFLALALLTAVDTLFNFKFNFANFLLSDRFWNSIKTSVVERFVVFQHSMDSVEQLAHNCADSLQWFLAVSHEMLEIGLDVGVMLFGAQGWHIKGRTDMT